MPPPTMWRNGWAIQTDFNLKKHSDMITIRKATKKEAKANAAKMKKHAAEMNRKQAKNEAK